MTWMDVTFKTEEPAELTELPDGRVEMSWPAPDAGPPPASSRFTVIVTKAEFAALVEQGQALVGVAAIR